MHAFDARRVDEYLELRHRPRQFGNRLGVELEAEVGLALPGRVGLVEVGAQGRPDQVQVAPQDAVLVEHRDVVQRRQDRLLQALLLVLEVVGGQLAREVETHLEQPHQFAGDVGVVEQRAGDVAEVEAQADLLEVARVGTQQRDVAPGQAGGQHQAVEAVVLGVALDDVDEGVLQRLVELLDVDVQPLGVGEGEIVNPELAAVLPAQAEGEFTEHAQAEVFQDRQHVGQRQRRVGVIELAVQQLVALAERLVEAHHQRALLGQAQQVLHVDHRGMRGEALAIAGREAFREVRQHRGALRLAEAFHHEAGVFVLPGAAGLDDFTLEQLGIDGLLVLRVDAQDVLHARQHRFGEVGPELAVAGLQALHEDLLDLHPGFGGVDVARHVGQAIGETAVGVLAQEQAQLVALLDLHDGDGGVEQLVHRGLEQVVARQHLQHLGQFLAQVRAVLEARAAFHFADLATDEGNLPHALAVHRGGVEPHETAFLEHPAIGVELADRDEIRVGRTVHAARHRGLGERQQRGLAQEAHRLRLDVQFLVLQARPQAPRQAQQRRLVVDHAPTVGLVDDLELLVAEEGEMVVQQPAEEHLDFGQVLAVQRRPGRLQPGQQLGGLGLHRLEVGNRQAHFFQHLQQRPLQGAQFAGAGAAVDLQEHQRFLAGVIGADALGQDFQQLAGGIAAHAEHAVLQGMDAVAAAVQLDAHRVDEERDVRMQHFHRGVGGLPAVLLVVRIEHPHLRRAALEILQQPPGRERAADQVGQPALDQLVEGDDAEELLGEQRHLWQRFFVDVLRQRRLQLVLEVGLAGCAEERHVFAPLDLLWRPGRPLKGEDLRFYRWFSFTRVCFGFAARRIAARQGERETDIGPMTGGWQNSPVIPENHRTRRRRRAFHAATYSFSRAHSWRRGMPRFTADAPAWRRRCRCAHPRSAHHRLRQDQDDLREQGDQDRRQDDQQEEREGDLRRRP